MADDQEEMDQNGLVDSPEPEAETPAPEPATPKRKRGRRGFRSGLVFGIVAGFVISLILRPKVSSEPAEGHPATDADGAIAGLRARLNEATEEAREAAHEAEEAKRARFSELLERE
jgi:hypothetical protein